eukprot:2882058-Prymnesium_polylepis.1
MDADDRALSSHRRVRRVARRIHTLHRLRQWWTGRRLVPSGMVGPHVGPLCTPCLSCAPPLSAHFAQ